jgi:hypothetical protein
MVQRMGRFGLHPLYNLSSSRACDGEIFRLFQIFSSLEKKPTENRSPR